MMITLEIVMNTHMHINMTGRKATTTKHQAAKASFFILIQIRFQLRNGRD